METASVHGIFEDVGVVMAHVDRLSGFDLRLDSITIDTPSPHGKETLLSNSHNVALNVALFLTVNSSACSSLTCLLSER